VLRRAALAALVLLAVLTTASAGASGSSAADSGAATAHAYGIQVSVPGQAGAATPTVAAPPAQVQFSGAFSYNGLVTAGSANASVSSESGTRATATAAAEVTSVSIFNGEITASSISAHAQATATGASATGDANGSAVDGLVALGQSVASGGSATLADWGTLNTIETTSSGSATAGYQGSVTALDIRLTADHDGLPAGTSIVIGYADVAAKAAAPPPPPPPPPKPVVKPKRSPPKTTKPATPAPEPSPIPSTRRPPSITPPLKTPGGYVFPVYGPSSFGDTFGAPRGDVSGGWHHGDDIFAPLGAPILAVATGTVFSVGWNEIGGNRLWLRDGAGNEFYYAHLSAYTPLAVNGNRVNAGDVLGFVGNTGDAQGTPFHLHFEVHPVELLGLGYDGAVDPTKYLNAWKHLQDVSFAGGSAWAPFRGSSQAPKPGAILISADDISSADGLDPGSLQRVMQARATEGPAILPAAAPSSPGAPAGQPSAAGSKP
jgi:murein DD-endopeptidase MepM/ murein hydrolase activator NlpD